MTGRVSIAAVFVWTMARTAHAETTLASDGAAELCEQVGSELSLVGIDTANSPESKVRRARRRAFANDTVDALVFCDRRPDRIEVYYPNGEPLGVLAFSARTDGDPATTAVYVSERIRSERFVADEPIPVPFTPTLWWLGVGGDALLSGGGIATLGLVSVDVGYRFARHWSLQGFAMVQPYRRTLRDDDFAVRVRLDQLGIGLAYHPVVLPRFDLALGARISAARLGADGAVDEGGAGDGSRTSTWLAFPAGRLSLRFGLSRRVWLRVRGEAGAIVPRPVVSTPEARLGSLGRFAAQVGLGVEVHFR